MTADARLTSHRGTLVVTGAGRGIGAATALLGAARGYAVAVNYARDEIGAGEVAAAIAASGGSAITVPGDVAKEADVVALFARAERELGPIAALVNNAGITGGSSRVADLSCDALQRTLAVNVIGSFLCAREAVRRMARSRGGSGGCIVNLSSRASTFGGAGEWVHYAASKGAIDTFTRGLALEVAADGIRATPSAPGSSTRLSTPAVAVRTGSPSWCRRFPSGGPERPKKSRRRFSGCSRRRRRT